MQGIGSAHNTSEFVEREWSPITNTKLEEENKRVHFLITRFIYVYFIFQLRLIVEQMRQEKIARETELINLLQPPSESLGDSESNSTNRPFSSKLSQFALQILIY